MSVSLSLPGRGYRKEGETLTLAHFSKFCNERFHLRAKALRLQDFRKKPEIPMATIYLFIVGSLALRKQSFHQIDLFARQEGVRGWMGSRRPMVASDCTLWRVLPRMDRSQVREDVQQAYELLKRQGFGELELPGGRRLRAAAVDGSALGGRFASVVEILGAHAVPVDLEPCEGKGKELPASQRVLRRVAERHGRGFVNIVLGDGLYLTQEMLRLCRRDLGTHLLVKTQELDGLLILQEAEALFRAGGEFARDVEHISGTDVERGLQYEVWAARGFHHADFPDELKVARLKVTPLKGDRKGQTETHWIVATDVTLSAAQMRELAHRRWSIENHTFRALSDHMNSKHVWTRGAQAEQTYETLLLLMMLAFTLVLAYHAQIDADELWESRRLRRVTLAYAAECLLLSLRDAEGAFSAEG